MKKAFFCKKGGSWPSRDFFLCSHGKDNEKKAMSEVKCGAFRGEENLREDTLDYRKVERKLKKEVTQSGKRAGTCSYRDEHYWIGYAKGKLRESDFLRQRKGAAGPKFIKGRLGRKTIRTERKWKCKNMGADLKHVNSATPTGGGKK